jgi:CTP:phosphocholine cytidylyltransferase-like protein
MHPFEEVKAIYTGEEIELKNVYMVNRIFSFLPQTFLISADINNYLNKLPSWAINSIYRNCIPTKKSTPFIPYQKTTQKIDQKLVQKISNYLCCSDEHARQSIDVLRLQGHKPESFFGLKKGE